MTDASTYAAQADAVERAAIGQRGYVDRLRELADRDERRTLEWETQAAWTPALEAAAISMRRVANQQAAKEELQAQLAAGGK